MSIDCRICGVSFSTDEEFRAHREQISRHINYEIPSHAALLEALTYYVATAVQDENWNKAVAAIAKAKAEQS